MRFFLILFFTAFYVKLCFSQQNNNCDLSRNTIELYNENSLYPIKTDSFNIEQFQKSFLSILDPYSIIFNSKDMVLFDLIQQSVNKDLLSSFCSIQNEISKLYKGNLENTIVTLEKFTTQNLNFDESDSMYIGDESNIQYYTLDKEKRCRNYIKAIIIQNVLESTSKFDTFNKTTLLNSYIDSIKINVVNKKIEQFNNTLNAKGKLENYIYSAFINSMLVQYDQHSFVFSDESFSSFKEQLSSNSNYFGFQLETNNKGEIVIASVIPGSYSWRTGQINAGDKVLKLEVENIKTLSVERAQFDEVHEFIASITSEKLTITLLKADNSTKKVDVYRETMENKENSVQAFILNGETKVGYIILPAFYTSWDEQNAFGCAQDVGRAIFYLKKENIESLIIDLRNNSGGSLKEAIDLAGIFVDYGTFSVSQNINNELKLIKDFNRGILYSDPLALMVNSHSASASEMVAAVLQDYNRAIIIGDTTYGKATGQSLLQFNSDNKNTLKLTTNKYYRVTGNSYYKKGIAPDITLPVYTHSSLFKKRHAQRQNFPDSIVKKTYYYPLPTLPIDSLSEISKNRINNNEKFKKLKSIDSLINTLKMTEGYFPLSFNKYYQIKKQIEMIEEIMDSITNTESGSFTIELLQKEKEMLKVYTYYRDLYSHLSKSIVSDPYIEETYKILNDYKSLKKN